VASDIAYRNGVAIVTMAEGGLIYEASVGGQELSFDPIGQRGVARWAATAAQALPCQGAPAPLSPPKVMLVWRILLMGFHEPEPLVDAARDLGQNVGAIGIAQLVHLFDAKSHGPGEAGERP
jgi:hypothetical protein